MSYETLVARLTAAIDDGATDGNVTVIDERYAREVLERLQRAHAAQTESPSPSEPPQSYSTRYTRWEAGVEQDALAYDRSVRALIRIVQSHAPRYADAEFDVRGNPIAPELRGEIVDPLVRALDPDSPIDLPPVEVTPGDVPALRRALGAAQLPPYAAAFDAAEAIARQWDTVRRHPPKQPFLQSAFMAHNRASEFDAAMTEAAAFVEYLDAQATPSGVE